MNYDAVLNTVELQIQKNTVEFQIQNMIALQIYNVNQYSVNTVAAAGQNKEKSGHFDRSSRGLTKKNCLTRGRL